MLVIAPTSRPMVMLCNVAVCLCHSHQSRLVRSSTPCVSCRHHVIMQMICILFPALLCGARAHDTGRAAVVHQVCTCAYTACHAGAVGQGQQVPAAEGGHARLQVLQQELRALSLKAAAAADAASNSLKQPGLQQQHQQQQSGFGSHHGASTVATGSTPSAPATGVPPGWPPFGTVVPAVCVRAAGPANGTTAPQPPPAAPQEVPRPPTSHVQTAGAAQQQGNHQQQRNQQARAAGAAPAAAGQQGGYAGAGQGQHARRRRRRRGAGRLEV
jgi:hypothetical protein